jgi:hypothetical protein
MGAGAMVHNFSPHRAHSAHIFLGFAIYVIYVRYVVKGRAGANKGPTDWGLCQKGQN